ncbi:MAG TPA: sigma 54-interacting transcriptional regulator [Vicinamibacterales bacterium]|nr:sigma 54-interacting transcriptional regulator [Vicinamibacterales bacterium]
MNADADRESIAGHRPAPLPPLETERLVVVRRDQFAAFAVLAQAYAGEPGVRLVWDRRRRERRGTTIASDAVERRQRDRRASPALALNDYLVFTRELLREPGALAFVQEPTDLLASRCRQTAGEDIRREIDAAAQSDLPVLISGGDRISRRSLARRLHDRSGRCDHQFRIIDRPAFTDLCDEWISGHRPGLGGLAGGTVLVEEIAHWTLEEQAQVADRLERLARARNRDAVSIQHTPLRIVSGSSCCLIDLVHERRFRADLFYRLNMVHLVLPSGLVKPMS